MTIMQGDCLFEDLIDFKTPFFQRQLITYIGNKRELLPFINKGVELAKKQIGKKKLLVLDGFSGSGVVSRLLKYHSECLYVNDLERYCEITNKCYLANSSQVNLGYIKEKIDWLNENKLIGGGDVGFIERNYAPKDDNSIKEGERVFYTNRNAKIIDNLRSLIFKSFSPEEIHFFLAPLLTRASIHTNTSGVFKGFHKKEGIGCFGGKGENALKRIKGEIQLDYPIFSDVECDVKIFKSDINELVKSSQLPEFDLVYYDPPYNQHPYGSNYFMLNIIASETDNIEIQNGVSGIIEGWNRSAYNKQQQARLALENLIENTRSRYILLSYNNEGLICEADLRKLLENFGDVTLLTQEYNTYRGSRNLRERSITVDEHLWVLKRS